MKFNIAFIICALLFGNFINAQELQSPNGNFKMNFSMQQNGVPTYELSYKGKQWSPINSVWFW